MLQFLLLLAAVLCSVAVSDRGITLEEKVRNLQDSIMKRPVMSLNLEMWKTYIQSSPHRLMKITANSYRYTFLNNKALYFGIVDYENAPQIFKLLNLNTAPAVFHFPAKGARRPQDSMDFQRMDSNSPSTKLCRSCRYSSFGYAVLGLLYMRRNNLEFLFNRTFWACVCLAIVFAFMSGQMWNHIRGPPFMMTHPHGRETSFIPGSTQTNLLLKPTLILDFIWLLLRVL
ncbi:unnamed protein product [Meloidogyne enterolobii]|uniref:Uncharacterized protein n=1 Tax=Meloidogyne enterolobii TaxID=390850 RepID=A0ACB1ADZ2_MELEN